jgi:hypothetical protein
MPLAEYWVGISAVDISGNESPLSVVESGTPLVGTAPELELDVTSYSVMRGELVTLAVSGANTYDWDIDGDGTYDILDDVSGTADVDTSQTGIIRPLVRGTGGDASSVACSAVSVINPCKVIYKVWIAKWRKQQTNYLKCLCLLLIPFISIWEKHMV